MSYLYVCEQGSSISFSQNRFIVKHKGGAFTYVPAETLEVIELFGNIQLTTQCMEACLVRGVNVIFYSTKGRYFGRLSSTNHINAERQRKQDAMTSDQEFRLGLSKKIIEAKIHNQMVVARRYSRNRDVDVSEMINSMKYLQEKVVYSESIEQLMGYEGLAAKYYFKILGALIESEFRFDKRTRRPPTDPFNSLISLGYSILMNEIYGKIEAHGLNPYFGFMHSDREKHPTLCSDLIEEWRAVLIDSTVMNMLNGHELTWENFYRDEDGPGLFLTSNGFKLFIAKLENKLRAKNKYLTYIDYAVSIRKAIDLQINQFVKAVENGDYEEYHPLRIR